MFDKIIKSYKFGCP